jgi:hypothetical protein
MTENPAAFTTKRMSSPTQAMRAESNDRPPVWRSSGVEPGDAGSFAMAGSWNAVTASGVRSGASRASDTLRSSPTRTAETSPDGWRQASLRYCVSGALHVRSGARIRTRDAPGAASAKLDSFSSRKRSCPVVERRRFRTDQP